MTRAGLGPDAAHGQLRIVRDRRAHPDHDRIDQGPQPVQVGKAGLAVDIMGVAGGGGDAGIDGLAALPTTTRSSITPRRRGRKCLPWLRQGTIGPSKRFWYAAQEES